MQAEKYLPFQDLWTEVCMFASQLLNHQMRQQLVESFSSSRIESDNVACKKNPFDPLFSDFYHQHHLVRCCQGFKR